MNADEAFDGVFMSAVDRCQGAETFFNRLFGFFKRKTDLFDDEAYAKRLVNDTLNHHIKDYQQEMERVRAVQ